MTTSSPDVATGARADSPRIGRWTLAAATAVCLALPLLLSGATSGWTVALQADAALGPYLPAEQPLTVRSPFGAWVVLAVGLWLILAAARRVRWPLDALGIALAGWLTLGRAGNAWLLGLVLLVAVGYRLSRLQLRVPVGGGLLLAVAAPALVVAWLARPVAVPDTLISSVRSLPAGTTVMAPPNWTTVVQASAPSGVRVLGASDTQAMPQGYWESVRKVGLGHATWPALVQRYTVTAVVVDPSKQPAFISLDFLRRDPAWQVVLDTGEAFVATRRTQP